MLDVVDGRRQNALVRRDHAARHLVRRKAGVLERDADDGHADIREDIRRRTDRGERA